MKTKRAGGRQPAIIFAAWLCSLLQAVSVEAVTTLFFDASQTTNLVDSGATSDTISSEGYLFAVTRDKLFTGGVGLTNPIGRSLRVHWPEGMEAQAVTAGPTPSKANILLSRQDGQPFDLASFTAKLLGNTSGAGAAIEIMPLINGEDAVADPFRYNASGNYGMSFSYVAPELTGFDAYKITLYVDFALMNLTVIDASLPPPALDLAQSGPNTFQLFWPTNDTGYVLEAAANVPTPMWTTVTNSVAISGDMFTVQVDLAGSQRFFRLRK